MLGIFKNGQPIISIEVGGIGASKEIDALIDSGFNGYLQMPFIEALPLGLVLAGISASTLADGSLASNLICKGSVCVDGKDIMTDISLQATNIVLLGTNLLKELGKIFTLDCANGRVEIADA